MTNDDRIRKAMVSLRECYNLLESLLPEERGAQIQTSLDSDDTVIKIRNTITHIFGIDPCTKSQKEEVVMARHAYRYLLRFITNKTYKSIAILTNTVDHHAVLNSIKICKEMIQNYKWYKAYMLQCKEMLSKEINKATRIKEIQFDI